MARPQRLPLLILLLGGALLVYNSLDITLGAFPLYAASLGASPGTIGLLGVITSGGALVVRMGAVRLSQRFGLWTTLITGMLVMATAPLLYVMARHPGQLALAHSLYVFGPSTWLMALPSLLTLATPIHRRGQVLGWYGAMGSASLLYGPSLGIWLYERSGAFGAYWGAAAAGAGALALAVLGCRAATGTVQPQLEQARYHFHAQNRKALLAAACTGAGLHVVMGFTSLYAKGQNADPKLAFAALALCAVSARLVAGKLLDRLPARAIAPAAGALLGLGLFLLPQGGSLISLLLGAGAVGAGHAASQTALMKFVIDDAGESRRAPAVGWFLNANDLGVATGGVLFGQLADRISFPVAYMTFAAITLLILPLSVRLRTSEPDAANRPAEMG